MPIMVAHRLAERLAQVRKSGELEWVKPDGKTQVTVQYDDDGRPVGLDTIIISTMHSRGIAHKTIKDGLFHKVILPVARAYGFSFSGNACLDCEQGEFFKVKFDGCKSPTKVFINPSGLFELGGPNADTGLTGRKIIVDTYGGMANHGGGCFSGKDATKVDRSGNYAARYVAKNVVKAGLARKCELELAYAIGVEDPVAISIDTFGTSIIPEEQIIKRIKGAIDLTPGGMISRFNLFDVSRDGFNYKRLSSYGHFGRDEAHAPWEKTDVSDLLR
jgi:S-adenosylmethionine synthetase